VLASCCKKQKTVQGKTPGRPQETIQNLTQKQNRYLIFPLKPKNIEQSTEKKFFNTPAKNQSEEENKNTTKRRHRKHERRNPNPASSRFQQSSKELNKPKTKNNQNRGIRNTTNPH
jgi:hypothetical protein